MIEAYLLQKRRFRQNKKLSVAARRPTKLDGEMAAVGSWGRGWVRMWVCGSDAGRGGCLCSFSMPWRLFSLLCSLLSAICYLPRVATPIASRWLLLIRRGGGNIPVGVRVVEIQCTERSQIIRCPVPVRRHIHLMVVKGKSAQISMLQRD